MLKRNRKKKDSDDLFDLLNFDDTNKVAQRIFNIKIKDKNYIPLDNSIKSKKIQIYELLKRRLLRPRDYIIYRNNNHPLFNTEKTTKIKKDIKLSKLKEKIEFGSLDYLYNHSYQDNSKNRDALHNKNRIALLNSPNFIFRTGYAYSVKKFPKKKKIIPNTELHKKFNKTVLGTFGLKKSIHKKLHINNMENELNKNYYNTESVKVLIDKINTNIDKKISQEIMAYTDKRTSKKNSKEISEYPKSVTPRNKNVMDKINTNYKKIKLKKIANKDILSKETSNSQTFNSEIISENKNVKTIKEESKKFRINLKKDSTLKNLILNIFSNNNAKKPKTVSKKNKRIKTKFNTIYRDSFTDKNNIKLLKNFEKYADLMDKENDENENINQDNIIQSHKELLSNSKKNEKERNVNKNFCKYSYKIISSLITDINSDQLELNNKLFKIIDRTNKKIKKEKKLDDVLEVILNKKLIKKKRIKAKEIYIDAIDTKKLAEERNRLRFMMRFADLIKNMKDEIALNYTKNIIDKKSKRKNEFNLVDLAEYKKRKEERYKEEQKMIRNRLWRKIIEIEKKIKSSEIEKDILYSKYENVFEKNKKIDEENLNIYKKIKQEKKYHNIDFILNHIIGY